MEATNLYMTTLEGMGVGVQLLSDGGPHAMQVMYLHGPEESELAAFDVDGFREATTTYIKQIEGIGVGVQMLLNSEDNQLQALYFYGLDK